MPTTLKNGNNQKAEKIRELGNLECFQSAQHLLGMYLACALTCRYKLPSRNLPNLEDIFERSVALVVLGQPLLQAGLGNEDSASPFWARLDRLDMRNHIQWKIVQDSTSLEDAVREECERQHNTRFENLASQPPWRLVVLHHTDVESLEAIFSWNHAIADGVGAKVFHEDLLRHLNATSSGRATVVLEDHILQIPASTSFTPPLEKLLSCPVSFRFALSAGWSSLRPSSLTPVSPFFSTWAPIQLTPCKTRIELITIPESTLRPVLAGCRAHNVTLTTLLHALLLLSISTRVPKDKARAFATGTPIDLRRFISHDTLSSYGLERDRIMTNLVTNWQHNFSEETVANMRKCAENGDFDASAALTPDLEASVWSVAKDVRQELGKKLSTGTNNDKLGLMGLISDWRSFMKAEMTRPRNFSWGLSNLGTMKGGTADQEQQWTIERTVFTQSGAVAGPAVCVCPVTVAGKDLTISFIWQEGVIEETLANGLASDLRAWMDGLAKPRAQ